MGLFSRRRIARLGPDRFAVRLDRDEREVLVEVCSSLAEALEDEQAAQAAPAFRRLFPVAHADDAELEAGYQELVHDELRATRLADLAAVVEGAEAAELDTAGLERWMRAINAVRLVFGTALDVGEGPVEALDPDDPSTPAMAVYLFLGYLLEEVVEQLTGS